MELCGIPGISKQAPIPEEILAFLPDNGDEQDQQNVIEFSDCAFCFAYDQNAESQTEITLTLSQFTEAGARIKYNRAKLRRARTTDQPRGPPSTSI